MAISKKLGVAGIVSFLMFWFSFLPGGFGKLVVASQQYAKRRPYFRDNTPGSVVFYLECFPIGEQLRHCPGLVGQTGSHGWRPSFQTALHATEVVVAYGQIDRAGEHRQAF